MDKTANDGPREIMYRAITNAGKGEGGAMETGEIQGRLGKVVNGA